jgi:hypothetical protein
MIRRAGEGIRVGGTNLIGFSVVEVVIAVGGVSVDGLAVGDLFMNFLRAFLIDFLEPVEETDESDVVRGLGFSSLEAITGTPPPTVKLIPI